MLFLLLGSIWIFRPWSVLPRRNASYRLNFTGVRKKVFERGKNYTYRLYKKQDGEGIDGEISVPLTKAG